MHFKEVDSINRNYRIYSVLQFVLAVAIFGTVCFIFSNSMRTGADSSSMSRAVQDFLQSLLRRLGHPAAAARLTEHMVRKAAHFCEYTMEGFFLLLGTRLFTPQAAVPELAGSAGPAHRPVRRDHPAVLCRPGQQRHRRLDRLCRRAHRHGPGNGFRGAGGNPDAPHPPPRGKAGEALESSCPLPPSPHRREPSGLFHGSARAADETENG